MTTAVCGHVKMSITWMCRLKLRLPKCGLEGELVKVASVDSATVFYVYAFGRSHGVHKTELLLGLYTIQVTAGLMSKLGMYFLSFIYVTGAADAVDM